MNKSFYIKWLCILYTKKYRNQFIQAPNNIGVIIIINLIKVSDVLSPERKLNQKDLIAANIVLNGQDNNLFIDPARITFGTDTYAKLAQNQKSTFFLEYQKRISADQPVTDLFFPIKEDNFVGGNRLGLSEIVHNQKPIGRGPGNTVEKALTRINSQELVKQGVISDFSTIQLYIRGINKDKISDMVTSIVKGALIKFMDDVVASYPDNLLERKEVEEFVWSAEQSKWVHEKVNGYFYKGNRVVLVPKNWISRNLDYTNRRFFTYFVFESQLVKDSLMQYIEAKNIALSYEEMNISQLKSIFVEVYGKPTKDVIAAVALDLTKEKEIRKINLSEYKLPIMSDDLLEYYIDLPYNEFGNTMYL